MNPPHRLNASNGQVVATSEAYETNAAAKKGCGSVQRAADDRACAATGHGLDQAQWAHYISSLPFEETCSDPALVS
jgi:hypothetical protein